VTLTVTDNDLGSGTAALPVSVTTTPPVASFTATPDNGDALLQVAFDASASYDPDLGGGIVSYEWDFGDGNSGNGVTASHTYQAAGAYTATLTVTDVAHATDDATTTITVTSSGGADIFVDQQSITRVTLPGNRTAAQSVMVIKDNFSGVQDALVYASYTGPTSGTVSGTTDASGSVTLETASTKKDLNLNWCFTITDIQKSGYTFNDQIGQPYLCEGSPKRGNLLPASCLLHPAFPNPFGSGSVSGAAVTQVHYELRETSHVSLRVYDALGREVAKLFEGERVAGSYVALLRAGKLPSGTYFIRLIAPQEMQTARVVLHR
jgi:PKD repeat protein